MSEPTRLTLAAAGASALAALTLAPVFATSDWLLASWVAVALVALVGAGLRSLGAPRPLVPLGQLAVLVQAGLVWTSADALLYGLPTPAALRGLLETAATGLADVPRYATPVPPQPGMVLLAAGGIALMALAVDALAVTARLVPWAGLPLLATYAVPAAVVPGGLTWYLFVPVAAGYLLLLLAETSGRLLAWGVPVTGAVARRATPASASALAATGRRVGAVVIAAAVVVPAVLPALPESVLTSGSGGEGGSGPGRLISTDNPIADLSRDLRQPANLDVLTYRTDAAAPTYIRRVVLDEFDGTTWRISGPDLPEERRVSEGMPPPPGLSDATPRIDVTSEFTVSEALDSRWLPLPYPATSVSIDGDWRSDPATLDVLSADEGTVAGATYSVTSLQVEPTAEQLRDAGPPPEELRRLTELAPDTQRLLADALDEALRSRRSEAAYDEAVAIQDWFRTTFEYSTEVRPGNSDRALASFLADRSGYCEQYAATMALMARALGIPARVGVGYLPGVVQTDGSRVVRAQDAHAWPELYFAGAGWVRFEPTPPQRTGAAPAWATPQGQQTAAPTTPAAPTATGSAATTGAARPRDDLRSPTATGSTSEPLAWGRIGLGAGLVGALLLTPAAALLVRRRRWRLALGPDAPAGEPAEAAWADLRDAVRDARRPWDPARTPRAAAAAIGSGARLPTAAREALDRLARALERARYAPAPASTDLDGPAVDALRADAATVRSALLERSPARTRLAARLLPAAGRDALGAGLRWVGSGLDALELLGQRLVPRR